MRVGGAIYVPQCVSDVLLGHLMYLRCPYKTFIICGLVFVGYKYGSYVENQHMCKISDT